MNDQNFGYRDSAPQPPGPGPAQPGVIPPAYKFSPSELQLLGECNRESFYQRSLPFGTFLGLGAYAAVQQGKLRPNPRFGAIPKVSLAVVMGYFLGKLSYQQACAEKLMALPDSYIGQLLRDRKDGKIGGRVSLPPQSSGAMLGARAGDIYSDAGPGSSLDLDTERPLFADDAFRPDNSDGGGVRPQDAPAPRPTLSYEELRRRNRGDQRDAKQDPYRVEGLTPPPAAAPRARAPTNKYGDAID